MIVELYKTQKRGKQLVVMLGNLIFEAKKQLRCVGSNNINEWVFDYNAFYIQCFEKFLAAIRRDWLKIWK